MLALKTPFGKCTMSKLKNEVWNGEQVRPDIDPNWRNPIKILLQRSWNPALSVRPSFAEVTKTLRKQCVDANGGNDEGLSHSRRRSTFIFAKLNLESLPDLSNTVSSHFAEGGSKRWRALLFTCPQFMFDTKLIHFYAKVNSFGCIHTILFQRRDFSYYTFKRLV